MRGIFLSYCSDTVLMIEKYLQLVSSKLTFHGFHTQFYKLSSEDYCDPLFLEINDELFP